jgi:hypothetical protein
MTPRLAMSFVGAAVVLFLACTAPDERCGGGSPLWWDSLLLDRKAHEDTPSTRWFWCERELAAGKRVQSELDWLGPITNLASGATRGEGKWVRVLADDATLVMEWAQRERAEPEKVGGAAARRDMWWRWAAKAKATFTAGPTDDEPLVSLSDVQARAYVINRADITAACFTVAEMVERFSNSPGCRYPDPDPGKAAPGEPPPGAVPPDRGGIDVPPGTTPGGGDEGDR